MASRKAAVMPTRRQRLLTPPFSLRRGLVAYWPLDEASGNAKCALYGAAGPFDLTQNGTIAQGTGPSDNLPAARDFEDTGSDQFFTHADDPALSMPLTDMTITAWVNPESSSSGVVRGIAGQHDNEDRGYYLRVESGNYQFTVFELGGTAASGGGAGFTEDVGSWTFLVGQYDLSRGIIIMLKNLSRDTTVLAGGIRNSSDLFTIGREGADLGRYFDGRIAHVGLWKRLLTQTELEWLYNDGTGRDLARGA